MLPYVPSFGMRNGVNSLPGCAIMMGLPPTTVTPGFLSSGQGGLSANNPLINKDSQWLTLEVCREYQRGMCPRSDLECKYAHPPPYLDTLSGRVVCCYDSIKGKCHRIKPPCKYLHPPQHLKDILIQNGKNNLLMKNLQMNIIQQQISSLTGSPQTRLGLVPMNPAFVCESQKSPIPDPAISISASEHFYANCFNVPNIHSGNPISTRCQTTQCLPSAVSSGIPVSMSVTTPTRSSIGDTFIGKKRPLTQIYQNGNKTEFYIQPPEDPVPVKRPTLSDTNFPGFLINRDQQLNPMEYLINPFMVYQNPLATYLALNNQQNLNSNVLNIPGFLANNSNFQPVAPGLICPSSQSAVNNLSIIANLQSQQHLAMVLNAANGAHGHRNLSEFASYKLG